MIYLSPLAFTVQVAFNTFSYEIVWASPWRCNFGVLLSMYNERSCHLVQDSPNKVGIMSSKSTGEPPLLTSVSVLTAFQAAITAAKQGLADLQAGKGSEHVNGVANGGTDSVREQVLKQLQAPVTVKEVKRVIGNLHLSQLLSSHEQ